MKTFLYFLIFIFLCSCSNRLTVNDIISDINKNDVVSLTNLLPKNTILGKLTCIHTSKPLSGYSVALAETTFFTKTDSLGNFVFDGVPFGEYKLIVFLKNEPPHKQILKVGNEKIEPLKITLSDKEKFVFDLSLMDSLDINKVSEILAEQKKYYEKLINEKVQHVKNLYQEGAVQIFTEYLIGNSEYCELLNPNDLMVSYDKKEKHYTFKANKPIIIQNNFLGYKLYCLFNYASITQNNGFYYIKFKGDFCFEKTESESINSNFDLWYKNRMAAFKGSPSHFLLSYIHGKLDPYGYELFFPPNRGESSSVGIPGQSSGGSPGNIKILNPYKYIFNTRRDYTYVLNFGDVLGIKYLGEMVDANKSDIRGVGKFQQNFITSATKSIKFSSDGVILNPNDIRKTGYWSSTQLSELLPKNFIYNLREFLDKKSVTFKK